MRWLSLLILLAGCDALFGLDYLRADPDASGSSDGEMSHATDVDARTGCSLETFSHGLTGFSERWNREYTPPASDVVVESDELAIKITTTRATGYAFTNRNYNLTDSTVSARIDEVIGTGDSETFLDIEIDDTNYYEIAVTNGALRMCITRSDNVEQVLVLPYDPLQHLYWRLQHVSARKAVAFLTSADGVTWTERHSVTAALAVDQMFIEVGAGIDSGSLVSGVARLDDIELCAP